MHPKDSDIYPLETKVLILEGYNKGKTAVIKDYTFQFDGKGFLNYLAEVQGRTGRFAVYHEEIRIIEKP